MERKLESQVLVSGCEGPGGVNLEVKTRGRKIALEACT